MKLQKHVKFYNKYVKLEEIIQYLKATDIYLSTSDNPNQITSGTLSYAMGCGRAVVSTPFFHAKDIVSNERGRLVEFKNPESIAKAIAEILSSDKQRVEMEKNAYYYTRHMTWQNVAMSYGKVFKKVLKDKNIEIKELPKINIKHLVKLTDDFGIIQFANQSNPDKNSGYTLDDNARALLTATMYYEKFKEYKQLRLMKVYLDYINYVKGKDGKLYNFVNKDKIIDLSNWSEDAHGRAIWALGYLSTIEEIPKDLKNKSENLFLEALSACSVMSSPRAMAFSIAGLYNYNKNKNSQLITKNIRKLADVLVSHYNHNSHEGWQWFEPYLTYSNSKLPEALFYSYQATNDQKYLEIAAESLNFLMSKTFENETFIPIGQKGWYEKDKERSYFDQQPVEAGYTVQTLIEAYKATQNEKYKDYALNAFKWFLGSNMLQQTVYNESTGGCHDGIGEGAVNLNQGAEATLSYLLARLTIIDV